MEKLLLVAIGGGIGASTRYLVSSWAVERFGSGFPYGTLIVNVAGCFIIGMFMVITTEKFVVNPYWRLLVTVGFLGGLTTFSSYSYETFKLLEEASTTIALYNVFFNLITGFVATWLGIALARLF
ncbi:fluoride efflux transporter CrcB [Dendrosporobacter sp. 1207_IL3150]|uniref:fluoride efflux transporter CrcB n=1 Tax=Dendrosporobacter sp. 1207_IL3150 TaxID=3084054 RepID=UPI002FDA400C